MDERRQVSTPEECLLIKPITTIGVRRNCKRLLAFTATVGRLTGSGVNEGGYYAANRWWRMSKGCGNRNVEAQRADDDWRVREWTARSVRTSVQSSVVRSEWCAGGMTQRHQCRSSLPFTPCACLCICVCSLWPLDDQIPWRCCWCCWWWCCSDDDDGERRECIQCCFVKDANHSDQLLTSAPSVKKVTPSSWPCIFHQVSPYFTKYWPIFRTVSLARSTENWQ